MSQSDFITLAELSALTGYSKKALYNASSSGRGPMVEILSKLGGRLGSWRADYELWRDAQRKLPSANPPERRDAA